MTILNMIDCNGLSAAPIVLRIKQALVGVPEERLPLGVMVDSGCDCDRIERSLGARAGDVSLAVGAAR